MRMCFTRAFRYRAFRYRAFRHRAVQVCAVLLCVGLAACSDGIDNEADATEAAPSAVASAHDELAAASAATQCAERSARDAHDEVWLADATIVVGSNTTYPEEAPATTVDVPGFWIDTYEVTNAQFAEFVRQTGYITTAEQQPDPAQYSDIPAELLKPGSAVFARPRATNFRHWTEWWRFAEGASWRTPHGPGSSIQGLEHHPVVHVSYLDAKAYATWRGRTLPTEAQWERAASVGAAGDGASRHANTWQGFFPLQNTALDGYQASAPVGCFRPNDAGLHDMIGNVWEWVSDEYVPHHRLMRRDGSVDLTATGQRRTGIVSRVVKGGSFLCASSYCQRDRAQGRQPQEEDFGAIHIGFRTVRISNAKAGL